MGEELRRFERAERLIDVIFERTLPLMAALLSPSVADRTRRPVRFHEQRVSRPPEPCPACVCDDDWLDESLMTRAFRRGANGDAR